MTPRPPRLVIHLGQHKTGSKALQTFLARHSRRLAREGVFYPVFPDRHGIPAYANSHHRLYVLLRHEALLAGGDAPAAARFHAAQSRFCAPFGTAAGFFEWLERERRRAGAHTVLLSAEDLLDFATAHETEASAAIATHGAARLAELARASGFAVRLIAYLRRQDHLLAAHYVQYIKGGGRADLDFAAFATAFAPRLCAAELLQPWTAAFGTEALIVRPYERAAQPSGVVADFFHHVLDRPVPPAWTPPPPDRESVNASPDRDHVEFIRRLRLGLIPGADGIGVPDVLDAIPRAGPASGGEGGAGAWFSPRERADLLATHAEGNARVAARFLGRTDGRLFLEAPPEPGVSWTPYPGLDAVREREILARARAVARRPTRRMLALREACRRGLRRLRAVLRSGSPAPAA